MASGSLLRKACWEKSGRSGTVRFSPSRLGFEYEALAGVRPVRPVLLDTGVIVALLDRSERHHARCVAAIEGLERPLVTCEAVIAESCYLVTSLHGAAEAVLTNVELGIFQIPFALSRSAAPVLRIMRKYRDLPVDFADACLIHLAEESNTGDILTLDTDFKFYRWRRTRPFHLLLDLG